MQRYTSPGSIVNGKSPDSPSGVAESSPQVANRTDEEIDELVNTLIAWVRSLPHDEADQKPRERDHVLHRIWQSGELTGIAQHLALAMYVVSGDAYSLKLPISDLETMTGWPAAVIKGHLAAISKLLPWVEVTHG